SEDGELVFTNTDPILGILIEDDGRAINDYIYEPFDDINGQDTFNIYVTDLAGGESSATITVNIEPKNDAPEITLIPDGTHDATIDEIYEIQMTAIDIDGIDNLTWDLISGPGDMEISEDDGLLTWTANADPEIFVTTYTIAVFDNTVSTYQTVNLTITQFYDCAGTPNGSAIYDECGVCDGDGIPAGKCDCNDNEEDCAGDCGGSAEVDECGVCDDDPSTDCIQDCNGDWGGVLVIDECNVCDGDGSSCGAPIANSFEVT
ncbi:uncharacterized protein METZ01_LOCUS441661, partial [marine metagenome]